MSRISVLAVGMNRTGPHEIIEVEQTRLGE